MDLYEWIRLFIFHALILQLANPQNAQNILTETLIEVLTDKCPGYNVCTFENDVRTNAPSDRNNSSVADEGTSCCQPGCHCDSGTGVCIGTGNCCLESTEPEEERLVSADQMRCVSPSFNLDYEHILKRLSTESWSGSQARLGVVMVSNCPVETNDTRRCSQPNQQNISENQPVTSTISKISYRNKYCAFCHEVNETEVVPWRAYVTCSAVNILKGDSLLFPNSPEKMFSSILATKNGECGFEFIPPKEKIDSLNIETCFINRSIVYQCADEDTNITEENKNACSSLYLPYTYSDEYSTTVYANYFCYLCNSNATNTSVTVDTRETNSSGPGDRCLTEVSLGLHVQLDFVVELNTMHMNESNFLPHWEQTDLTPARYVPGGVKCKGTTTYDLFTEKCREWFCPSGWYLSPEGACLPLYLDAVKASFSVTLQFRTEHHHREALRGADMMEVTTAVLDRMYGDGPGLRKEVVIVATMDDYSYLFVFAVIHVTKDSIYQQRIYDPSTYGSEISIETHNASVPLQIQFSVGVKMELNTYPLNDIILVDMIEYKALMTRYRANISDIETAFMYTFVTPLSFCTQISLDRTEVRDYIDVADIRISDTRIYTGEFSRTSRYDTMRICLSSYLRKAEEYYQEKLRANMYTPQAIISVVCNIMSMAGLLVTIITYIIFEELRTIPGKNNMMLAVHLLIAQSLYQFGMDKTEFHNLCIVFGILIHLFWLTAIFWMNVCTLHMFRTFVTGQSYRSVRALDPQVLCYGGYCYGVAMAMVAVNISVSMYKSDGAEVGYGGRVCYITNPVMVGWVFALPVGIIIILNMGFFFAVVYQISASTMRRRGKQTDRTNTVIYMKLSSLTGVTWIFGYLYLWTNFEPLEYIFIVLNAGQGVFIFISFICTKRILKLYWNMSRNNCLMVRARCCSCLCFTRFDPETAVEMNTQKVSLTAGSTSKGFLSQTTSVKRFFTHRYDSSRSLSEVDKSKKQVFNNPKGEENSSAFGAADLIKIKRDVEVSDANGYITFSDPANGMMKNTAVAAIGRHNIDFISSEGNKKPPETGDENGHM
ncbi:uncharacterized protein LOC128230962 [Mya arenaria]|uniref:uncharacterized protein LOC128230962 n=1 Tax=Mya arenaria TaxID=6604 RepID=UPI0022E291AE|nr:uncharacterized protein LOC128230962 [Mya arenaria]